MYIYRNTSPEPEKYLKTLSSRYSHCYPVEQSEDLPHWFKLLSRNLFILLQNSDLFRMGNTINAIVFQAAVYRPT